MINLKPCKKCGTTDRNMSGHCRFCKKINNAVYQEANLEKIRADAIALYKINPEKRRASSTTWSKNNPEKKRTIITAWRKNNPDKANSHTAKHRAARLQAIPKWIETDQISILYAEANMTTIKTGIRHEVDHIVPLQSGLVCGLHCLDNLRIITKTDNSSKGNRYWPDMPL